MQEEEIIQLFRDTILVAAKLVGPPLAVALAVGVLMSLELCLNAAAVNFVLFNRYLAPTAQGGAERLDGAVMTIFVIAVAAAEVVVGMAIFVAMYAERRTVDVTRLDALKD